MEVKVGYHIGTKDMIPMGEKETASLIVSALEWEEKNGPVIIFADETFSRMLYRMGIEDIYMEIIPVEDGMDRKEIEELARDIFPVEIHPIEGVEGDDLTERLPDHIWNRWAQIHQMEELIFKGGSSN
jgi:hypothetical protein